MFDGFRLAAKNHVNGIMGRSSPGGRGSASFSKCSAVFPGVPLMLIPEFFMPEPCFLNVWAWGASIDGRARRKIINKL
jgi:hypothetical protein